MTTIRAHFDGKAFVPDEPVALPTNLAVTLHVDAAEVSSPKLVEERLRALDALEVMGDDSNSTVADWSRDSIYSGSLDDPR